MSRLFVDRRDVKLKILNACGCSVVGKYVEPPEANIASESNLFENGTNRKVEIKQAVLNRKL